MSAELKPFKMEDWATLQAEAHADDHRVVAPTHTVWKHGEIVGYASVNGAPSLHWWLHTKKGTARDTLALLDQCDDLFQAQGVESYIAAVGNQSPYIPVLAKIGFSFMSRTGLYLHNIRAYRKHRAEKRAARKAKAKQGKANYETIKQ